MIRMLALLLAVGALAGTATEAWAAPTSGEPHQTLPVEPPPHAEEIADAEGEVALFDDEAALGVVDPHASSASRAGMASGPPSVPPPR